MTRLHSQPVSDATGPLAELFTKIKAGAGRVPRAYVDIGSNSPLALEAALTLDAAVRRASLSPRESEIVKLAVSEIAGCDYCVAAHTLFGKKVGLSEFEMTAIRHGQPSGDEQIDALAAFARTLVTTRGTVPEEVVRTAQAHLSDSQIVDILLVITSITFANLFNRVNDTELDFPRVS